MPSKTITVTNGDGSTKTITIPDRSRFAGTRTMSRVTDGVTHNITVDRTAQVVTSDRKGESRPLLTKVVGGASAAYSLRDLNDRAGKNKVVRVRRASDNTEKDFKASDISSGAMTQWVNSIPETVYPSTGWQGDGVGFTNTSSSNPQDRGFTANNVSTGVRKIYRPDFFNPDFRKSSSSTVTFTISNLSGGNIQVRLGGSGYNDGVLAQTITEDGTYTQVWETGGYLVISPQGTSVSFSLDTFSGSMPASGFVSQWYDQSGNGNDAVQETAGSQPKIVDAGVLVSGGIEFDGVDDRLACPSLYSSDISVFNVVTTSNTVNTGNFMRTIHLCDGSDSFQLTRGGRGDIGKLSSRNTAFQSGTTAFRHGDINGENLISAITSSTDTDAFIDGSLQSNGSSSLGSGNDTYTTIGARDDLVSSTFFAGSHAELIIYPSDQSANRAAIEANINNQYDIY